MSYQAVDELLFPKWEWLPQIWTIVELLLGAASFVFADEIGDLKRWIRLRNGFILERLRLGCSMGE
jgi:hypothetical protein